MESEPEIEGDLVPSSTEKKYPDGLGFADHTVVTRTGRRSKNLNILISSIIE